jgi:hypothetical protein
LQKSNEVLGAPEGNKNAEIWTFEEAKALFDRAFTLSKRKCNYNINGKQVKGYEFDFIGELTDELDIYRDLISRDLPGRFPECDKWYIMLKSRMETNCYSNTKKGIIKEGVGIVNLKSNHGWKDKSEIDHKNNGESFNNISDAELIDRITKLATSGKEDGA